jgi:hypothetical protein
MKHLWNNPSKAFVELLPYLVFLSALAQSPSNQSLGIAIKLKSARRLSLSPYSINPTPLLAVPCFFAYSSPC